MNENVRENFIPNAEALREAKRYLPNADQAALNLFAVRQFRARLRLVELKIFYAENFCRMTRLHLLGGAAIALGRFCGISETFDEIGEALMPCDRKNQPTSEDWKKYAEACRAGFPVEVRDELWLTAHFKDIETVRTKNLEEKYYAEAALYENEPIWQLLNRHLEVTLGVRLMDESAIAGLIPHETAIADSLALTVKKLSTAGLRLVGRFAKEAARAAFDFSGETPQKLLSYRQTAIEMLRYFALSFTVSKIFRQGIRTRQRGTTARDENWSLLELALGEEVEKINPLIREFYANPSRFDVTATLKLETLPAKFWSRFLTFLLGQGLYETDLEEIPAQFRIFQRQDGSMHFIRELYCHDKLRVFDSDFVVRNGKLYEVFVDLKSAIEMKVAPLPDGGISISAVNFLFRDLKLPNIGLHVEFQSRVENDSLKVVGRLTMQPKTEFGKFFAAKILRRPENLGSIHYSMQRKNNKKEKQKTA